MIVDDPVFLSLGEVIEIHHDQIERYGGHPGIRDIGLLQSVLAMPAAGFGGRFLHMDLFEMAAAYLFHIIQNHPFIDGNKRTGAVASLVFLSLNGVEIEADEEEFEKIVLAVVKGSFIKLKLRSFFGNITFLMMHKVA